MNPDLAGYFYTGEAARILNVTWIDYAQMRVLLRLIRPPERQPTRKWARYDLRDLACLREAIRLADGPGSGDGGPRSRLLALKAACHALQQEGYEYPLLEIRLDRRGSRLVATAEGVIFEPADGQLVMDHLFESVDSLATQREIDADIVELRKALNGERRTWRKETGRGKRRRVGNYLVGLEEPSDANSNV